MFHPSIEEHPERAYQNQDHQVLDLSLPFNMQETIISDNTRNDDNREYLPDLLNDKTHNKNHQLLFDVKPILREEEEVGKDRTVDGAEIDIIFIE